MLLIPAFIPGQLSTAAPTPPSQEFKHGSHKHLPATKMVVNPPQKRRTLSSKELYKNPSQTQSLPLPVAGSCAWMVVRMATLLHFILPGQTVLGTGEKKKMRRGSSRGCAGVWPPQEEVHLLWGLLESTCRLPLPSQALREGWGLPSWYWCLGFPLLFILFLSARWFSVSWGFFHSVWWFLDHPHSAAASGIKFDLTSKGVCATIPSVQHRA